MSVKRAYLYDIVIPREITDEEEAKKWAIKEIENIVKEGLTEYLIYEIKESAPEGEPPE